MRLFPANVYGAACVSACRYTLSEERSTHNPNQRQGDLWNTVHRNAFFWQSKTEETRKIERKKKCNDRYVILTRPKIDQTFWLRLNTSSFEATLFLESLESKTRRSKLPQFGVDLKQKYSPTSGAILPQGVPGNSDTQISNTAGWRHAAKQYATRGRRISYT